jgi:hypothetical protein
MSIRPPASSVASACGALILLCTGTLIAQAPAPDAATLSALKEAQPWTDKSGRVIIATAKSFDEKEAVFILAKENREVKVPMDQLSAVSVTALRVLFAPAAPPAPTVAAVAVTDGDAIKAAVGTEITVEGKVKSISELGGGHVRVNFADTSDFVLFIQKRSIDASPDWKFDELKDKTVRVKGKIVEYQGKLEIVPEKPEQIVRID